ncbi:MAG: putative nitrogen fixation protein NifT [Betaproteobacteria bacterium]|nr:putative nitrogen fixation protein NifT [Betaproteobacteria bacterium]
MKVTIRKGKTGDYSVYVPKKDLETAIVETERADLWGGTVLLANGWRLALPSMPADTPLPVTVDARRLGD